VEKLLNYKQAAEFLAVGKSTVYGLVSEGLLTCIRFGAGKTRKGVTRFREQDLEAFVKSRIHLAKRPKKRGG
jgi:excisionase family DNA binding protein